MENNSMFNIVATECGAEVEERFNKWYDEVHVPLLFKYQGMKKVTRLKCTGENPDIATYLAVYEFGTREEFAVFGQSPERTAAMAEMKESWPEGGFQIKWAAAYEATQTWER